MNLRDNLPLFASVFALCFACGVYIYVSRPASAQTSSPPPAQAPAQLAPTNVVPIGVAPFGQGRSNPVGFFVEPSTRRVYACEYTASNVRCVNSAF
jgi:hypothetical protein